MKRLILSFLLFLYIINSFSQNLKELSRAQNLKAITELKDFVSLPNDALNPNDISNNIKWLSKAFADRNFDIKILKTTRSPLFFAERHFKGATKTILFYMHFDGQGVDTIKWNQPKPFELVVKEKQGTQYKTLAWINSNLSNSNNRLFGRSVADDKGPIVMFLNAIDILDKSLKGKSHINIKVILDGEEEQGSKHLAAAVKKYKNILQADIMVIDDGPMHLSNQPTLIFGCRGITSLILTTYGPRTPQHSGHYGNYAPNPVFAMARLLNSFKDADGRVKIPGYYDGIRLDADSQKILKSVPDDAAFINKTIGIAQPEKVGRFYQESLQYPSLNVRGMQSAWIGNQTRTIVPDKAIASIDIRLVPESDPVRLQNLIKKYITQQGFYVIDHNPTEEERLTHNNIVKFETGKATLPFRTPINSEAGQWVIKAMQKGLKKQPIKVRIMGGTVPISPFINALNIPAVIVPLVNADNNQHSPNENLKIANISNGIQTFLALMTY